MTILVNVRVGMAAWAATQAKARFSEVLDKAETEGPQRVQRRKQSFILLTEREYAERTKGAPQLEKPFVSAWEALKPSFDERYDLEFERVSLEPRPVDLG